MLEGKEFQILGAAMWNTWEPNRLKSDAYRAGGRHRWQCDVIRAVLTSSNQRLKPTDTLHFLCLRWALHSRTPNIKTPLQVGYIHNTC